MGTTLLCSQCLVCGVTKECFLSPVYHSPSLLHPFSHNQSPSLSQPQSSLHPNKCQSGSRISLPVLHSSHKSGVGTLCMSLRRKLFLSDEPRIHLPPTLTLPALSFNRLGQLTSLEEAWRACQLRLVRSPSLGLGVGPGLPNSQELLQDQPLPWQRAAISHPA